MRSSLFGAFGAALLAFTSSIAFAVADSSAEDGGSGKKEPPPPKPCTIRSPTSGHFFDLNPITVRIPGEKEKKKADDRTESWHAKGYDYGANFTLNFCAPVVEDLGEVEGVDKDLWRNVSAYYTDGKRKYSIG
jgi:cation-dependent mannose-6-phosphate receptor